MNLKTVAVIGAVCLALGICNNTDRFPVAHAQLVMPVCDGTEASPPTTDDTAAIQAILDDGLIFTAPHGKLCKITQSLVITHDDSGIVSDGSGGLYMPAANFNNTTLGYPARYGTNSVGVYIHGLMASPWTLINRPVLRDVRIIGEVQDGRFVNPVVVQNATQAKIIGNEIAHFPLGVAVRIQSCWINCVVADNYIHDFLDNTTGWNISDVPQITGIEVDNDIFNNLSTYQANIHDNMIRNMLVGAAFLAKYGYQTDCINVARNTSYKVSVNNNHLDTCAEGIDNFGIQSTINNNNIMNTYNFGIKAIHGAGFLTITGNNITNYGYAGVGIFGSTVTSDPNVDDVVVSSNSISFGNYGGNWAAWDNAAILVRAVTVGSGPVNIFLIGNILRPADGDYAYNIDPGTSVTIGPNLAFAGLLGVSK